MKLICYNIVQSNFRIINPNFNGPRKSFSRGGSIRGSVRGSVRGVPVASTSSATDSNNLSAVNEMEDNDIYEEYNDSDSQSSEMIGK